MKAVITLRIRPIYTTGFLMRHLHSSVDMFSSVHNCVQKEVFSFCLKVAVVGCRFKSVK